MDGAAARRLPLSLPEKATHEAQAALVGSEPETFSVPSYVARHGWVAIELARVDPDELAELIEDAWRMTAPKRLVRELDR
jgi:hypothetical protein